MPKLPRLNGKAIVVVVVIMAVAFAVTGLALQGGNLLALPGLENGSPMAGSVSGLGTNGGGSSNVEPTASSSAQTATSSTIDRIVVFTGSVSLNVTNSSIVFEEVQNVAQLDGGYVTDSSMGPELESGSSIQATEVVRVPAEMFDKAMADLQQLGQVISAQTSSKDVTDSYVNLNASLLSYEKLLTQYESFMNLTTNVNDALAVQAKVESVQQTIDSLTAQIQEMSNQVSLATITVTLSQNYQEVTPMSKEGILSQAAGFAWALATAEGSGAAYFTLGLSPSLGVVGPTAGRDQGAAEQEGRNQGRSFQNRHQRVTLLRAPQE